MSAKWVLVALYAMLFTIILVRLHKSASDQSISSKKKEEIQLIKRINFLFYNILHQYARLINRLNE